MTRRALPVSAADRVRFMKYVRVSEAGCWLWTGYPQAEGYGKMRLEGRLQWAHRAAWRLFVGPVPTGLDVLHHCDNPPCVNPAHLFIGTHRDNMADARQKGRFPRGSAHWRARLTEDDVKVIRASSESHRVLAARYGVSDATIGRVRSRRNWAHV